MDADFMNTKEMKYNVERKKITFTWMREEINYIHFTSLHPQSSSFHRPTHRQSAWIFAALHQPFFGYIFSLSRVVVDVWLLFFSSSVVVMSGKKRFWTVWRGGRRERSSRGSRKSCWEIWKDCNCPRGWKWKKSKRQGKLKKDERNVSRKNRNDNTTLWIVMYNHGCYLIIISIFSGEKRRKKSLHLKGAMRKIDLNNYRAFRISQNIFSLSIHWKWIVVAWIDKRLIVHCRVTFTFDVQQWNIWFGR